MPTARPKLRRKGKSGRNWSTQDCVSFHARRLCMCRLTSALKLISPTRKSRSWHWHDRIPFIIISTSSNWVISLFFSCSAQCWFYFYPERVFVFLLFLALPSCSLGLFWPLFPFISWLKCFILYTVSEIKSSTIAPLNHYPLTETLGFSFKNL